jgi:hypothetical protein
MKRTMKIPFPRVRAFSPLWDVVSRFDWWIPDKVLQRVRIDRLIATQPSVTLRGLAHCAVYSPLSLVKINGRLYIRNGHHRAMRAFLRGQKTIQAEVVTL